MRRRFRHLIFVHSPRMKISSGALVKAKNTPNIHNSLIKPRKGLDSKMACTHFNKKQATFNIQRLINWTKLYPQRCWSFLMEVWGCPSLQMYSAMRINWNAFWIMWAQTLGRKRKEIYWQLWTKWEFSNDPGFFFFSFFFPLSVSLFRLPQNILSTRSRLPWRLSALLSGHVSISLITFFSSCRSVLRSCPPHRSISLPAWWGPSLCWPRTFRSRSLARRTTSASSTSRATRTACRRSGSTAAAFSVRRPR